MSTIALDPVAKAHTMYDILNEPDSHGIAWEGGGSGRSMTNNYLAMMDQARRSLTTCLPICFPAIAWKPLLGRQRQRLLHAQQVPGHDGPGTPLVSGRFCPRAVSSLTKAVA